MGPHIHPTPPPISYIHTIPYLTHTYTYIHTHVNPIAAKIVFCISLHQCKKKSKEALVDFELETSCRQHNNSLVVLKRVFFYILCQIFKPNQNSATPLS